MVINILLLALIILRFVIGANLFALARRNNLPNLYWLAIVFFNAGFTSSFAPSEGNPLGNLPVSLPISVGMGYIVGFVFIAAFNQTTFYRDRKSPIVWYAGISAILALIGTYGMFLSESNFKQHPWVAFFTIPNMLLWGWHLQNAYAALAGLANEQGVEDWVKARYRLIISYAALLIISQASSFVRIFFAGGSSANSLGASMGLVFLIVQIAAITAQFLVWVMPEGFRNWLNRNQRARAKEQMRSIMGIVSSAMADGTGYSSMAALIAIRKMIGDTLKTDNSEKIDAHIASMGYNEWFDLLNNPEFYVVLKNTAAPSINMLNVVTQAKQALADKQSLFTMQAK